MKTPDQKKLIIHPAILFSIAIVIAIFIWSIFYYINGSSVPNVALLKNITPTVQKVMASGVVESAENPELTFTSGGRVAFVHATVGEKVYPGQVLASLDTGVLDAGRAQAQANLDVANAQLAEIIIGARQEDVRTKQTAVELANATLSNLYASTITDISQSYDKAFSGLSQYTDNLFNQPNTNNPTLFFSTADSQLASVVSASRVAVQSELSTWKREALSLSGVVSDSIEPEINTSLAHLRFLRTYNDQLLAALSGAVASSVFPQSSISAAQASVGTYRDNVNTLISLLQGAEQQIATAKLGVQSATDTLSQVTASSTPEQIAAQRATIAATQASVDSIDAQIRNSMIIAPFAGTVASVHIKTGDIVPQNTPAVALNPESALQVVAYFSEIDITKLHTGDTADVTLDAYGPARVFRAKVLSVDSAPSQKGGMAGVTGYKAAFQFVDIDPALVPGMNANITISLNK